MERSASPTAGLVIRPSHQPLRRTLTLGPAGVLLLLGLLARLGRSLASNVGATLLTAAIVAAVVTAAVLIRLRQTAGLEGNVLWQRDCLGRCQSIPRRAVAGLAFRAVVGWNRQGRFAIFHAHDGRALLTFPLDVWSTDDMLALARGLHLRLPSPVPELRRRADLVREFPGCLGFADRHPVALVLLTTLLLMAGIVAAGVVLAARISHGTGLAGEGG